jgi:cyclophilin family peptidyl-prolyl cis-trans isomerase/HEAT repeat protein
MRPFSTLGLLFFPLWTSPLAAQRGPVFPSEILRIEDRRAPGDADLAALRRTLSHRDPRVISLGARGLGRLERPRVIPWLVPLLAHPEPVVRAAAAQALAQAAQGFRRDSSGGNAVRRAALDALAGRVTEEKDSIVRGTLALSLGRLPLVTADEVRAAREHLLLLAGSVGTDRPESRDIARGMERLVRSTWRQVPLDDALVTHLVALVSGSRDEPTRRHALGALLVAERADSRPLSLLLASEDAQSRRLAVTGLPRFPAGVERDRLRDASVGDPSPMVRIEAFRAIARMDSMSGCNRLAAAAVTDSSIDVALIAIDLLARCDSSAVPPLLMAMAPRPADGWHRAAHGLVSLARLAPKRAREPLTQASAAPVWQTRMYAARAAGQIRDTATLLRLAGDQEPNVREAAIAALVTVMGHGADSVYRRALRAFDYQLVIGASAALTGSPEREAAVPALLAALRRITLRRGETSRDARIALLIRLRALAGPEQAAALEPYLVDFDPVVADSAAVILRDWTGRPQRAAARRIQPAAVTPAEVQALYGKVFRVTMASGRQFDVELFLQEAPLTVARLARLIRRRYFDGLTFHRVVSNFVIQGGSPGANEYAGDGPFMRDELSARSHERGTLGVSTRGRDTGDGQIFVNLVDNPRLDFDYTVWGRVIGSAGLAVVDAVREGDQIRRVEIRSRGRF